LADLEERLAVLSPHLHDGVALSVAARRAGVPLRTARRWLASYRAGGSAGLNRAGRADHGDWRIPAELVELVEGLALRRPPPRIAEVHRKISEVAQGRGLRAPSYQSVRRIIRSLDRGLVAMAHHGPDVYRDDFELVLRRESLHANDIWQADHTLLDLMVVDASGAAARPRRVISPWTSTRWCPGWGAGNGAVTSRNGGPAGRSSIRRRCVGTGRRSLG
jgi:putative transposase